MKRLVLTSVVAVIGLVVACVWAFGAEEHPNLLPNVTVKKDVPVDKSLTQAEDSLSGIKGVKVEIRLDPKMSKDGGLIVSTVQTAVELKLRQVGIKIQSDAEQDFTSGKPVLGVLVDGYITEDSFVRYGIVSIQLQQGVKLYRDSSKILLAITWQNMFHMSGGKVQGLRSLIDDAVDEFLNAYLKANPKSDK